MAANISTSSSNNSNVVIKLNEVDRASVQICNSVGEWKEYEFTIWKGTEDITNSGCKAQGWEAIAQAVAQIALENNNNNHFSTAEIELVGENGATLEDADTIQDKSELLTRNIKVIKAKLQHHNGVDIKEKTFNDSNNIDTLANMLSRQRRFQSHSTFDGNQGRGSSPPPSSTPQPHSQSGSQSGATNQSGPHPSKKPSTHQAKGVISDVTDNKFYKTTLESRKVRKLDTSNENALTALSDQISQMGKNTNEINEEMISKEIKDSINDLAKDKTFISSLHGFLKNLNERSLEDDVHSRPVLWDLDKKRTKECLAREAGLLSNKDKKHLIDVYANYIANGEAELDNTLFSAYATIHGQQIVIVEEDEKCSNVKMIYYPARNEDVILEKCILIKCVGLYEYASYDREGIAKDTPTEAKSPIKITEKITEKTIKQTRSVTPQPVVITADTSNLSDDDTPKQPIILDAPSDDDTTNLERC